MTAMSRATILRRFTAPIDAGRPIIGGGAGTGLSAKSEEAGGIDLIVICNSGRYRMAARGVREDVIVICHGGPIAMPDDAAYVLEHCNPCHGFYGASSAERLPTEIAIRDQIKRGKEMDVNTKEGRK